MRLPPITPKDVLKEVRAQPDVGRKIGHGWILVGSLVAVFSAVWTAAHFLFGEPVVDKATGRPLSDAEIVMFGVLLGGGGLFFVAAGFALRRWLNQGE